MSLRAVLWALYEVGPAQVDPIARLVLIVMADQVDDAGAGCFVSKASIGAAVGCDERTVRRKQTMLAAADLIRPGDRALVAYLPADKRPNVWDLALPPKRGDRLPRRGGTGCRVAGGQAAASRGDSGGTAGGQAVTQPFFDPIDPKDLRAPHARDTDPQRLQPGAFRAQAIAFIDQQRRTRNG